MRDISADFDPDTEAIRADEIRATVTLAAVALFRGEQMPTATPLQRDVARLTETAWRRVQIREMRARVRH
jgi:hypothetical protein